jgi:predicted alpha-1,2-mannosidase
MLKTSIVVIFLVLGALSALADLSNTRTTAEYPVNRSRVESALAQGYKQLDVDHGGDLTLLVNPFIGTGATYNPGNVFPGASVPFGMAKVGIDVDEYAPAGYNDDLEAEVRGMSLLHDTGTGSSSGSFGNFESMPVICDNDDYINCPTSLDHRKRQRRPGTDYASPGYFTTTLNNSIIMEATSTRRAGLLRYTFSAPSLAKQKAKEPFVVFDWTNDLPGTFRGGEMRIDPVLGRLMMNGSYASSFGSSLFTYQAFACYDLLADGQQELGFYGIFESDRFGQNFKAPNATYASQPRSQYGGQPPQRGALISWKKSKSVDQADKQILIRAGVSYVSAEQACLNAEQEIPTWDFDGVHDASRAAWNEKLSRLRIANDTDETIAELVYTSFYRSFLSPNNASDEGQGLYANTTSPYFDGLYCTWDTFRTFFPFLSLTSPAEYGQIVQTYIDGWRKQGFIPECRANNVPGFTQGGSDGTNVLADFAVKYRNALHGVDLNELYDALYNDATTDVIDWSSGGRQIGVYEKYGYIPFGVWNLESIGPATREGSRTLEYAYNDFGIRNVALLLGKTDDAARWSKRAMFYKNVFDHNTQSLGFRTFVQRRYANGTFGHIDPTVCSPIDTKSDRSCSLQQENVWTVYETSSFEYSFFVPHDFNGAIQLLSNGSRTGFVQRLDTFFDRGLYYSGNEPSFQTPIAYTYANAPTRSVKRVRQIVYQDFNTTNAGLPGNDDNGAMATLLLFHLLGLYPVPSTREFVIVSPFLPHYTLNNTAFGTVTVIVNNFDKSTLNPNVPHNARGYVKSVTINGVQQSSRCKISFDDLFPSATQSLPLRQDTQIVFEMATKAEIDGCGPSSADLPSSMSTGGFDRF